MPRSLFIALLAVHLAAQQTPKETAWLAYTAAKQNRRDLIPTLASLLESYSSSNSESRSVPPETAAIEAIADALIQLHAQLPASTVMHLYPQLPAQTVILLSRASDNTAPLLDIFQTTKLPDLWLAAGNLLALHPTPLLSRSLLDRVIVTFNFRVINLADTSTELAYGEGCAADSFMAPDPAYAEWPRARMYALVTSHASTNIFAPGINPVAFRYWDTTDYRDSWTDGDCTPSRIQDWRFGLLAQLQHVDLPDLPLKSRVSETIPYTSDALFLSRVKAVIEEQSRALADLTESFVQAGILGVQDSAEVHLQCRIQLKDDRPLPLTTLPSIEGKWCAIAPLNTRSVEPELP